MSSIDLMLIKPPDFSILRKFDSYYGESIIGEYLGLAYISAYCQKQGIKTQYIGAHLERMTEQQLVDAILEKKPLVIGFLLRYPYIDMIANITKKIKQVLPSAHIIVG